MWSLLKELGVWIPFIKEMHISVDEMMFKQQEKKAYFTIFLSLLDEFLYEIVDKENAKGCIGV